MTLTIRPLAPQEMRSFIEVHRAAVRGIACADYAPEVIEAWAPLPITNEHVEEAMGADDSVKLVALLAGKIIGIGEIKPDARELKACYVHPDCGRMGVGSAIVFELERIARAHGAPFLTLSSSLTAKPFYAAMDYQVLKHDEHILRSGVRMACVKMLKELPA